MSAEGKWTAGPWATVKESVTVQAAATCNDTLQVGSGPVAGVKECLTIHNTTTFLEECARYFEGRPTHGEDRAHWSNVHNSENCLKAAALVADMAEALREAATPIKMILHCPACGLQHIDEPSPPIGVEPTTGDGGLVMWTNPPHRSHLCHGCGHIWRPADVATEGVARIETVGKADSPRVDPQASLAALTEELDRLREGLEELLNLDRVAGVPVDSEACSYWAGQVDEMRSIASSTLTARPTP